MEEILRLKYDIPDETTVLYNYKQTKVNPKISTNKIYSWLHWRKRWPIAERFHNLTKQDCKEFETIKEKVDLRMRFYFKKHSFDSSNCSFMAKMIEDSLVKNWLLTDDTNKFVWEFRVESVELTTKQKKEMTGHYVRIYIYKNK